MEILLYIDTACFHFINITLSNPIFDFIMPLFHHEKYLLPMIMILWMFAVCYDKPNRWKLAIIPLVIILVDQSGVWIKNTVSRPRPFQVMDPAIIHHLVAPSGANLSFPSNHAANMSGLAVVFSAIYYQYIYLFWSIAGIVIFSRIYIGVHYPSDVIAGWFIGTAYGLLLIKSWRFFNRDKP
mgnify:CR=1 FL=1